MAEMLELGGFDDLPDIDEMDKEELRSCLQDLRERIAALDEQEPRNMESEEYGLWGERHELLEDLVDDILDRLDDMQ